jgi:hypothetical protein
VRPGAERVRPGPGNGARRTENAERAQSSEILFCVRRVTFYGLLCDSDARGDGIATIGYGFDGLSASRERLDACTPEHLSADYIPPPGIGVMRLVVEIDSGSEDARQLAQRARNWRARWDQTIWPPATHTIFLWITDKGFARLEAIWSAWTKQALLPAFFTTVETLSLGTGRRWHPWKPRRHLPDGHSVWVWHDMTAAHAHCDRGIWRRRR